MKSRGFIRRNKDLIGLGEELPTVASGMPKCTKGNNWAILSIRKR